MPPPINPPNPLPPGPTNIPTPILTCHMADVGSVGAAHVVGVEADHDDPAVVFLPRETKGNEREENGLTMGEGRHEWKKIGMKSMSNKR